MNERSGNRYFCPSCADYDKYLGKIDPNDPAHPVFEEVLADEPTMVVGMHCMRYPYPEGEESIGTIIEYRVEEDTYAIETDLDEPFDWTTREIDRETFFEYLWTPDGPDDTRVPEELCLGVHR